MFFGILDADPLVGSRELTLMAVIACVNRGWERRALVFPQLG